KTEEGRTLAQIKEPKGGPLMFSPTVFFSPKGQRLAYFSGEKRVSLWHLETQAVEMELDVPGPPLNGVVSPGEQRLGVLCGGRKDRQKTVLVVWDLGKKKEIGRWEIGGSRGLAPPALAASPTGDRFAVSNQGNILILDALSGKELLRLESAHKLPVLKLVWQ